jgi:hypothetical protein
VGGHTGAETVLGSAQTAEPFPVYHSWSFTTGTSGTFEASVRKLVARPVGDAFGKRTVRFEVPGFGLDPQDLPSTFELEGALAPPPPRVDPEDPLAPPSPGFTRAAYPAEMPGGTARDSLRDVLDQAGGLLDVDQVVPLDPGLVPPTYGRWHADLRRLSDVHDGTADPEAWVREVNLDPRQRAAAGLGAAIVRARQDDYLLRAWRQVGELRHANQRLREGELAVEAAQSMFDKHLSGADTDRALLMTAAAHRGIAATPPTGGAVPSVWSVLRASTVPSAVQDAAFARMTRPGRALVGGATVAEFQDGHLLEQLADGSLTAAPPVPTAAGSSSVTDVMAALTADLDAAERAARTPATCSGAAGGARSTLTLPPVAEPAVRPAGVATLSAALGGCGHRRPGVVAA